jgi:hypothetical protein
LPFQAGELNPLPVDQGLLAALGLVIIPVAIGLAYENHTPHLMWVLCALNVVAIFACGYIVQSHISAEPLILPSADEVLSSPQVTHDLNSPPQDYTVKGRLHRDASALGGRSIWVANRVGTDRDLNHLNWDAYNREPCNVDGRDWSCHVALGEARQTGDFSVYVFLATADTAARIIQGKEDYANLVNTFPTLPEDDRHRLADLDIQPDNRLPSIIKTRP